PEWSCVGPQTLGNSPVTIHMYATDVDAVVSKAVAAGATASMPVMDMFWGDRYGKFVDPYGHHWSVATKKRDVSPAEMIEATKQTVSKPMGECKARGSLAARGAQRHERAGRRARVAALPSRLNFDQNRALAVAQCHLGPRSAERAVGAEDAVGAAELVRGRRSVGECPWCNSNFVRQRFVQHERIRVGPLVNGVSQCRIRWIDAPGEHRIRTLRCTDVVRGGGRPVLGPGRVRVVPPVEHQKRLVGIADHVIFGEG